MFAYGPADATAIPNPSSLASFKSRHCFIFVVLAYPGCLVGAGAQQQMQIAVMMRADEDLFTYLIV